MTVNYTVIKQLVSHGPELGQSFAATPYAVKLTLYRLSSITTPEYMIQMDFNFIDNIMHLRHEV